MQLVENNEIEKLNLLIPENPFLNFAEESNFKLNLLLIPDPFYTLDYFIQFTYEIDMELINNYRLLYFLPFPHYIHISKLKFKKIKTKEEFNKYYICPKHKRPYEKFCYSCSQLFCSKCDFNYYNNCCSNMIINKFNEKINFEKFNKNKNKAILVIKKILKEFFHSEINNFNNNDFCNIDNEKIFFEKVEKLKNNNKYPKDIFELIKLLILDINSFILSGLKIFNSKNYFNKYNSQNIFYFEEVFFPALLEPKIDNNLFFQDMAYFFLEENYKNKNNFKSVMLSTLKNFIYLEKIVLKSNSDFQILRTNRIDLIQKIKNNNHFFVIFNNPTIKICNSEGKCVLKFKEHGQNKFVQISKNIFINKNRAVTYIEYDKNDVPISVKNIKTDLFKNIEDINEIFYVNNILILLVYTNSTFCLNFYYVYLKNNKFSYQLKKSINLENDLNISYDYNLDYLDQYKLIFNEYNSTIFLLNIQEEEPELILDLNNINIDIFIFDLNNFNLNKNFRIRTKNYDFFRNYDAKIINKHHLMIINDGEIINISLKTYEIVNIYQEPFFYIPKNSFKFRTYLFNSKEIIIFNNCHVKVFEIEDELYELKEIKNSDKYKFLEKFKNKKINIDAIECLDNGLCVIGYRNNLNFFNERLLFVDNDIEFIKIK